MPGRPYPLPTAERHFVLGHALKPPFPHGIELAIFGLGCFWGAERKFWQLGKGIFTTAVGYAGGVTPNPTYEEVCSGKTGHSEVVLVAYDPKEISYETLLKTFWEAHDPTQGMRQGNDVGTQYRSVIYTTSAAQQRAAEASKASYGEALKARGSTRSRPRSARPALLLRRRSSPAISGEESDGYCGLGGTGVACQIGTGVAA